MATCDIFSGILLIKRYCSRRTGESIIVLAQSNPYDPAYNCGGQEDPINHDKFVKRRGGLLSTKNHSKEGYHSYQKDE